MVVGAERLLAGLNDEVPAWVTLAGDRLGLGGLALAAVVVAAALLVGGALGLASRRRSYPAIVGFIVIGAIAAVVAAGEDGADAVLVGIGAGLAVLAGSAALLALLARAPRRAASSAEDDGSGDPTAAPVAATPAPVHDQDRRRFLLVTGGAALGAGVAAVGGLGPSADERPTPSATPARPRPPSPPPSEPAPEERVPEGVLVPDTIDPTGRTDVGAALSAWLTEAAKEHDAIRFPPDGVYRIDDAAVVIRSAKDVVIDFDGATLRRTRLLDRPLRYPNNTPFLSLDAPAGVTIRNLTTDGVNTNTDAFSSWVDGTFSARHENAGDQYLLDARDRPQWIDRGRADLADPGKWGTWVVALAFEHGIEVLDGVNVVVEDCTVSGMGGDGVYIGGDDTDGIVVRRVVQRRNGRQGIAVVAGHHILIEECDLRSRRGGVDLEPDHPVSPFVISDVEIRNCTIRSGLLAFPNQGRGAIDGVFIHHNRIHRSGTPLLQTTGGPDSPRTNYRFEDNVDLEGRRGPLASLRLQDTHGMVIARNTIPRQPHPDEGNRKAVQLETVSCTDIVVRDNDFENAATVVDDMVGGSTWTAADNTT